MIDKIHMRTYNMPQAILPLLDHLRSSYNFVFCDQNPAPYFISTSSAHEIEEEKAHQTSPDQLSSLETSSAEQLGSY
jgi:hypothetical protein